MLQLAADENFNNDIVRGLKRRDPLLDCSLQSAPGKRRRCDRPAPRGRLLARVKERWFGSSIPGRDHWPDHFQLDGALISPISSFGAATARLLRMNPPERVSERRLLQSLADTGGDRAVSARPGHLSG